MCFCFFLSLIFLMNHTLFWVIHRWSVWCTGSGNFSGTFFELNSCFGFPSNQCWNSQWKLLHIWNVSTAEQRNTQIRWFCDDNLWSALIMKSYHKYSFTSVDKNGISNCAHSMRQIFNDSPVAKLKLQCLEW